MSGGGGCGCRRREMKHENLVGIFCIAFSRMASIARMACGEPPRGIGAIARCGASEDSHRKMRLILGHFIASENERIMSMSKLEITHAVIAIDNRVEIISALDIAGIKDVIRNRPDAAKHHRIVIISLHESREDAWRLALFIQRQHDQRIFSRKMDRVIQDVIKG